MFTTNDGYKVITSSKGEVIDIASNNLLLIITSYYNLDKEIIIDHNNIKLGQKKKRKIITTIEELRNTFNEYMPEVLKAHCWLQPNDPLPSYLSEDKMKLLIDQIMFDVLFEKYLFKSEKISASEYARRMGEYNIGSPDSARQSIRRQKKDFFDLVNESPPLLKQVMLLGLSSDEFNSCFTDKGDKKPKFMWDYYYYNRNMITGKQYKRNLKKDSNYSYETFIGDLNIYNEFVEKMLPVENDSPKKFFEKTMDFYFLESYKRIDFILKVANIISYTGLDLTELKFLLNWFTPLIYQPYEKNGLLNYGEIYKYYRPLLIIEDKMQNEIIKNNDITRDDLLDYQRSLDNYRFLRARMYEIFKYNCEFSISNANSHSYIKDYEYSEIKEFMTQCYNLYAYHQSNEIWKTIKNIKWEKKFSDNDQYIIELFKNFFKINDLLFSERSKQKESKN